MEQRAVRRHPYHIDDVKREFRFENRRRGLSGRVGATLVVILLTCSAICFFYLPGNSNHFPSSCSLPAASMNQLEGGACKELMDAVIDPDKQNCEDLQEITEVTGQGETLLSLMGDNIPDEASAQRVATTIANEIQKQSNSQLNPRTVLRPGIRYTISLDKDDQFLKATIEMDPANVYHIVSEPTGLRTWKEEVVLDFKTEVLCFKMRGSLVESIMSIGEGAALASELARVFRYDINFQSESLRGDTCRVLFERRYADDKPSGYGQVLAAVYEGKKAGVKTAVWFKDQYYDEKGVELKKSFLRSPLSVIRITSHYGKRFHPVLRVWRKHNGVDYGAAAGTPVKSIANGVVTFAGWQNGYGKYVIIRHNNGYESRYGHLQKYFVQVGQSIRQGDRIGLVGMTGLATGPHLDFQLLSQNRHVNPLSVIKIENPKTVVDPLKPRFLAVKQECLEPLMNAGRNAFTKAEAGHWVALNNR
jgi:murein DD-endopeptidase MepM/ murein hydrolase activator NlpD